MLFVCLRNTLFLILNGLFSLIFPKYFLSPALCSFFYLFAYDAVSCSACISDGPCMSLHTWGWNTKVLTGNSEGSQSCRLEEESGASWIYFWGWSPSVNVCRPFLWGGSMSPQEDPPISYLERHHPSCGPALGGERKWEAYHPKCNLYLTPHVT